MTDMNPEKGEKACVLMPINYVGIITNISKGLILLL